MHITKSFFDIFISTICLIIFTPIFILTALMIKITSKGPILFRQRRVGINEKTFIIYKFRSMKISNSSTGDIVKGISPEEARNKYKTTLKNDQRITPIGKLLRKYHIDEIPQLINVIKGEMSIVGPRPYTPSEIVDYKISHWKKRHIVKPGITGFTQLFINGINGKKYSRICMDLFYVRKRNLKLDMYIISNTIIKIFKGNSF